MLNTIRFGATPPVSVKFGRIDQEVALRPGTVVQNNRHNKFVISTKKEEIGIEESNHNEPPITFVSLNLNGTKSNFVQGLPDDVFRANYSLVEA